MTRRRLPYVIYPATVPGCTDCQSAGRRTAAGGISRVSEAPIFLRPASLRLWQGVQCALGLDNAWLTDLIASVMDLQSVTIAHRHLCMHSGCASQHRAIPWLPLCTGILQCAEDWARLSVQWADNHDRGPLLPWACCAAPSTRAETLQKTGAGDGDHAGSGP